MSSRLRCNLFKVAVFCTWQVLHWSQPGMDSDSSESSEHLQVNLIYRSRPYLFRDGILERHFLSRFLGINSKLLRLKFLSGFLPSFSFLQNACHKKIKFYCFGDFLFVFLKPEKSLVFFKNQPVERIAWSKRFNSFFKRMSKNSISGLLYRILFQVFWHGIWDIWKTDLHI